MKYSTIYQETEEFNVYTKIDDLPPLMKILHILKKG